MTSVNPRPNTRVLGVVLMVRHGDRQGFYQNATSYKPTDTAITPLGNAQHFLLGRDIRNIYLNSSSPSYIEEIDADVVRDDQILVRADAGGEGGVIFNSAVSFLQGMFPSTVNYNTTLANGTTIVGPLGGYQAVPIESVEPDNDVSLEGWTECHTFEKATTEFYQSEVFKTKAQDYMGFLSQLPPYLDGRAVSLENMWNIHDYMAVQYVHNETFAKALPPTFLEQARHLANYHEWGVFSSPKPDSISNIAGHTILPSIFEGLQQAGGSTQRRKFTFLATSYKPFVSLFNLMNVAKDRPELESFVNFAGAIALEVHLPEQITEPRIRFKFKNGTDDEFKTYNIFGKDEDIPLSTFINELKPYAFDDTPTWCRVCGNSVDRGCAELAQASSANNNTRQRISPVGAGFLGAGLTALVAIVLLFFIFRRSNRVRGSKQIKA